MIRFLLPIFLLLAAFPLAAQGCYQNLQNGAGVSADPSRASSAACKLRESLPEANRASFATYSASLYRFAGNFAPGAAEALVTRLEARAAAASPYYLLIVWEASEDNLFATPHVRVNLPADGPFTCLNPLRRSAWQARLLLQAQGDAPKAKDPEDYLRAETKLMEELSGYVKDLIKCCQQGQTCPDCITRKERIALLKAYPFRTIGETSYDPAALKYRVDNVEIPGNSTAQIRDGIGIPLDLGGGPVDIAETLKQLALEKPELGLNALIVHDSLLCDPELLPGRFFGGSGLRSAGSQVYVILQRDGKVDVLGDATLADQINEVLSFGLSLGLSEAEITVGDEVKPTDPCIVDTNPGSIYYTPSGKLIKFKAPIAPKYSSGRGVFPIGSLTAFTVGGKEYWGIYSERKTSSGKERKFMGYLLSDSVRTWRDPTTFRIPSKIMTNSQRINNNKYGKNDEIETNVSNAYLKMSWLDNGVGFSYELNNANDKGPLDGAPLSGDVLLPENLGGANGCKPCQEGPGAEFYALYEKQYENSPGQLANLCQIAAIYNLIGKEVVDGLTRGDWSAKSMGTVYGNPLGNPGFSPDLYLIGLKAFADWYKQSKSAFDAFVKLDAATKLYASVHNVGPEFVKNIPLKDREKILEVLLTKNLSFANLFDKTFRKDAILSLLTNIKESEMPGLMTFLSDPGRLDFLFSSNGFGNVYGDDKFKDLLVAMIKIWNEWLKSQKQDKLNELTRDGIVILGKVKYNEISCGVRVINNESTFFSGGNINVSLESPSLKYDYLVNSGHGYYNNTLIPVCDYKNSLPVKESALAAIRVYFLTELNGIGAEHTERYMPAFLFPYLAKGASNANIKDAIDAGLIVLEAAGYAAGIGELAAIARLSTLAKVVAVLDVVSTTSEYAVIIGEPLIKKAFGESNQAAYQKFMAAWKGVNVALGVGTIVLSAADLIKNLKALREAREEMLQNPNLTDAEKQKLAKLNGHIDDLLRAADELGDAKKLLGDLVQRLKAGGMNEADAVRHAGFIQTAITEGRKIEKMNPLSLSSIPSNFVDLYGKASPEMQSILQNILSTWDEAKLNKFYKDLSIEGITDFFKTRGRNAILAWEYMTQAFPLKVFCSI